MQATEPDPATELEDELSVTIPPGEPVEEPEALNDDEANRLLRRRRRLLLDIDQVNAVCDAELRRIGEWRARRLAGPRSEVARIEAVVEAFMRAVKRRSHGKVKSLSLPNGFPRLTAPGAPKVSVPDGDAFVEWALAQERPGWVNETVTRRPDLAAIKKDLTPAPSASGPGEPGTMAHAAVDADGEVVPGVVFYVRPEDRFRIDPPRDAETSDDDEDGAE